MNPTQTAHTPGPWTVEYYEKHDMYSIEHADDNGTPAKQIAYLHGGPANAHLIAQAPAMLEALKAIAGMKVNEESDYKQILALCMGIAEIARAKAEGNEPYIEMDGGRKE